MSRRWRRGATALLAVAMGWLAAVVPCAAQTAERGSEQSAVPSVPPHDVPGICLATVGLLVALRDGVSYVIALEAGASAAGIASGTIAMYTDSARYDVPFRGIIAASSANIGEASPLLIRFPSPVRVRVAYISALDGPTGGPCVPFLGRPGGGGFDVRGRAELVAFMNKAQASEPVSPPPPVPLPPINCSEPNRNALLVRGVPPPTLSDAVASLAASTLRANLVDIDVKVILDDHAHVVGTRLLTASGVHDIDQGALWAARNSSYRTERFRCQDVGGAYKLRVEYRLPTPP